MPGQRVKRFKTISDYYQFRGLSAPEHPLVSILNLENRNYDNRDDEPESLVFDFYSISLKRVPDAKMKYGQQTYDFDEGVMFFMAPGQVFNIQVPKGAKASGWVLLVHSDFLWSMPLAGKIKDYEYFSYSVHEALHLSLKEEQTIGAIFQNIEGEYRSNIDKFSQDVIIAQIELLLTYSERFYQRQFITRKIANHRILSHFEEILAAHFSKAAQAPKGLPTVHEIAAALALSPNYLSGLLKVLTGQSAQQHIHDKLIEKAKEKLSTTDLSVSEIAYELGFEHPQSFSKLFKAKMEVSPGEFRASFN